MAKIEGDGTLYVILLKLTCVCKACNLQERHWFVDYQFLSG